MDTDKVIQDLNRRFTALLPEFCQCCIISIWMPDVAKRMLADGTFADKTA